MEKSKTTTPIKNLYWTEKGKFQKTYNRIWESLIPASGEAGNSDAEAVRCVGRIYYDWFNNGFCNAVEGGMFSSYYGEMYDKATRYLNMGVTARLELEEKLCSGNDDEIEYFLELFMDDVLEKAGDNITDEEYLLGSFHKINSSIKNMSSLLEESIYADLYAEDYRRIRYCTKSIIQDAQAIQRRVEELTKEKK